MMTIRNSKWQKAVGLAMSLLAAAWLRAADGVVDARMLSALQWREIGPFRGGRTRALAGVSSQQSTFYIGAVNGGVFKTTDYGHTWTPIFDHESSASVGSIAVAPSDPNVIYVGSGEGLQRPDLSTGDGVYKSVDAGKTWTHLGLRNGQQIPKIAVDPRDANRLFVAVLGHPYGPNEERGLYRSGDGGQTFQRVLYKDENTGANDVAIDPANPDTVYTSFWEARQGPWENSAWSGTNGGIFKSTDGGQTWKPAMEGLPQGPEKGVIQANLAVAPSETSRIYASVATQNGGLAIYRSDDSAGSWKKTTSDVRPAARIGGGDLPVPTVDPKNPDIVYFASTVTWKSVDGGATWKGIRGAPGGDDYQGIWINPENPEIMLVVSDQGAIVTVNGGVSWGDWYNQPTAQMYHVAADNSYPYRLCSGQQESGSACISSRGNDGQVTVREWHPVGVEEYGNAVPDPLDPDMVYGGKVTRFDRRTGQVQNVGPKAVRAASGYRTVRTAPLVFSTVDPHTLFFASNTVWKTRDGGMHWSEISPDLTRKTWSVPESVGKYRDAPSAKPSQRGVIYALSPSPRDLQCLWTGTDDGQVHVTFDGGSHWKEVTPKQLTPWAKISIIDASHFDKSSAYLAVNTFRLDDLRPHLYRTHDAGATWREIINGIPDGAAVNVIREDPARKGLLFAGSERSVYVSFDDGDHWQALRLNMPATSIRDLLVKGDDLVAATHGRGFWILDDITPLRQMSAETSSTTTVLFRPQTATRVRWDMNTDTPLPPDTPAGKNPPDGAVINYYLGAENTGEVQLKIVDASGHVVRQYASSDRIPEVDPMLPIPKYWVRPPQRLDGSAGMHRFVWDLHYTPLPATRQEYPMQAVFEDTAPAPNSPWVMPGTYTVQLVVGGKTYSQPLTVRMDPRVKTGARELLAQFSFSRQLYDDLSSSTVANEQIRDLRDQLQKHSNKQASEDLDAKLKALAGETGRFGPRFGAPGPDTLANVNGSLMGLLNTLQAADAAPTSQALQAVAERRQALHKLMLRWKAIRTADLPRLNSSLRKVGEPELVLLRPGQMEAEATQVADDDDEQDLP